MRKVALAAFLVILLSPLASAETYRISGKATYADTTPVSLDYVYAVSYTHLTLPTKA